MSRLTITLDPTPSRAQPLNTSGMKELVKKTVERIKYSPENDPSLKRLKDRLNRLA